MEFDITKSLSVKSVKPNIFIPSSKIGFGSNSGVDSFKSNSVDKYINEEFLKRAIATNPKIKQILSEIGASPKLNMTELNTLSQTHSVVTRDIATGIIQNLPKALKTHVNVKSVKDAAYLHDIGKVLIPAEILNKEDKLNDAEREIMHKHAELGYELLKNSDIDTTTLHLIKYHHQNMSHSGYPKVRDDFFADINLQILNLADKYSALTEARAYKNAYAKDLALAILYKDVYNGDIHPFVYKALVDYVKNVSSINKTVV